MLHKRQIGSHGGHEVTAMTVSTRETLPTPPMTGVRDRIRDVELLDPNPH